MSKFKIGDRVVCVTGSDNLLTEGKTYVVEGVYEDCIVVTDDSGTSCGWYAFRFKPSFNKWHPHHDLIIEWLENKDAVVEFKPRRGEWGAVIGQPFWNTKDIYRITYPNRGKQSKIDEINQKIEELKQKVKELEDVE